MKKQTIDNKKLGLNKETLMPLTNEQLEGANGGFTPFVAAGITIASAIGCEWVGNKISVGPRC